MHICSYGYVNIHPLTHKHESTNSSSVDFPNKLEITLVRAHKTLGLDKPRGASILAKQRHQSSARIYTTHKIRAIGPISGSHCIRSPPHLSAAPAKLQSHSRRHLVEQVCYCGVGSGNHSLKSQQNQRQAKLTSTRRGVLGEGLEL